MSQADYYQNGNHSACDTLHSPLSTLHYYTALSGRRKKINYSNRQVRLAYCPNSFSHSRNSLLIVPRFSRLTNLLSVEKNFF
ncbi:MAG: hypothetical protein LBE12_14925 [Planctomycetaceae bacterium]|nr:hypothetical protein [Planctomycetaceae bacterium]